MGSKRFQLATGLRVFVLAMLVALQSMAGLKLNLALENMPTESATLEVQIRTAAAAVVARRGDLQPGIVEMALAEVPDGDYFVYVSASGYTTQWQRLTIKKENATPGVMQVKLFRKRYVVLRYAFNTSGGRELSGKAIKQGRVAVAHWGQCPFFGEDWQVWQQSSGSGLYGDTPVLRFHRISNDGVYGFANAPAGVAFNDLKEAPAETLYTCADVKAEKGVTLLCHVDGGNEKGLGYGKVVIEEVTLMPPAGVEVIDEKN